VDDELHPRTASSVGLIHGRSYSIGFRWKSLLHSGGLKTLFHETIMASLKNVCAP
jgi:hypothetical protein